MTRLAQLLDAAVQKELFVDEPVAAVLSGGVDSSSVVMLARKWRPELPTFTGWYDEPGFDERKWARMAGSLNHCEVEITPQDFIENFDDMARAFAPPLQGMGMFGQYMVAKAIRAELGEGAHVLSGEGSDELFGGYARLMNVARVPLPDGYENYVQPAGYPATVNEALAYDHERLPDLLAVDDQALGAFGLLGRAPFTHQPVVDYALALPLVQRIGKQHLKDAMRGIVPDPILDRTDKMGMPCPLVKWANQSGPVASFVLERLGELPDPAKPWDRAWFHELCDQVTQPSRLAA